MKGLESVNNKLKEEEEKLRQVPITISELEKNLEASNTLKLHRKAKPIPGSFADDQRIIDEVDKIRLRAIVAIQALL